MCFCGFVVGASQGQVETRTDAREGAMVGQGTNVKQMRRESWKRKATPPKNLVGILPKLCARDQMGVERQDTGTRKGREGRINPWRKIT